MAAPKTIFCDIDGTLIVHKKDITKNIFDSPIVLSNVIESVKEWDRLNYKIILTTGRKESTRKQTENQLAEIGVVYDQLVMGITNGDRIIINDKKFNGVKNTCYAINLVRNKGLSDLDLTSKNVTIPDKHLFIKNEASWGNEELIESNDKYIVKKVFMKKNHVIESHYHELKMETIVILSGKLIIYLGENLDKKEYVCGETTTIVPNTFHKIESIEDSVYFEVSTNELWDNVLLNT
jgi:quercetin dioxygenase-like cupin family protein